MCGIFGYCGADVRQAPFTAADILPLLAHRGPDDHGSHAGQHHLFGATRLAVIAPRTNQQPAVSADGNTVLVFNGELYNRSPLRCSLTSAGCSFRTQDTETEVLLHLLRRDGPAALARCNGIFALACWREDTGTCLLARDRCGTKPLYYTCRGGALFFASELKALLRMLPGRPPLDLGTIGDYFTFGYIPSPATPFAGIAKLPAGSWLSFRPGGQPHVQQYWDLDLTASEDPHTALPARAALAAIPEAIRQEWCHSDGPVGIALSGGLDSTAVLAQVSTIACEPVRTYCLQFPVPSHDESGDAALAARHFHSRHTTVVPSAADYLKALEQLPDSLDEPFADPTFITLQLLAARMSADVKVALTGIGGDEVFAGYPTLTAHRYASWYRRLPAVLRQRLFPALVGALPPGRTYFSFEFKARRFIRGSDDRSELQHLRWMAYTTPDELQRLLHPVFAAAPLTAAERQLSILLPACRAGDLRNRILYLDFKLFLENNCLFQADRAGMSRRLEFRVPFLNHGFLDVITRVPVAEKLRAGTKTLLRDLLGVQLPRRLRRKPKKGFGPPLAHWLQTIYHEPCRDILQPARLSCFPYVEPREVARLLAEHYAGRHDHSRLLWLLLVLQLWLERYGH